MGGLARMSFTEQNTGPRPHHLDTNWTINIFPPVILIERRSFLDRDRLSSLRDTMVKVNRVE